MDAHGCLAGQGTAVSENVYALMEGDTGHLNNCIIASLKAATLLFWAMFFNLYLENDQNQSRLSKQVINAIEKAIEECLSKHLSLGKGKGKCQGPHGLEGGQRKRARQS